MDTYTQQRWGFPSFVVVNQSSKSARGAPSSVRNWYFLYFLEFPMYILLLDNSRSSFLPLTQTVHLVHPQFLYKFCVTHRRTCTCLFICVRDFIEFLAQVLNVEQIS